MSSNADSDLPAGVAVALTTDEGVKVYLVGVSHISRNSARDAVSAIESVQPGVVVLELDEERYRRLLHNAANYCDTYIGSKEDLFEVLQAAVGIGFGGFLIGNLYRMGGALCGTNPGLEMYAADEAAKEVGARVILGDRPSSNTIARTSQAMWQRQPPNTAVSTSKQQEEAANETLGQSEDASANRTSMNLPDSDGIAPGEESSANGSTSKDDPWGLKNTANKQRPDVSAAVKSFLQSLGLVGTQTGSNLSGFLALPGTSPDLQRIWGFGGESAADYGQEGGCANADVAMASFRQLMRAAWESKTIDVADVAAVRDCLRPVLEHYRDEELRGGKDIPEQLLQLMNDAKADAGVQVDIRQLSNAMVKERDIILARRLWEATQQSGDRPVVGVVGARHIKGIVQRWPDAGSWETKALADEYCKSPTSSGSQALTAVITSGVIAVCAYKFPRTAGVLVGAGLAATAASVTFTAYFLNRFAGTTNRVAEAAKHLDELQGNNPMSYD